MKIKFHRNYKKTMDKCDWYSKLNQAYIKAHPQLRGIDVQRNVDEIWAKYKKDPDISSKILPLIEEYERMRRKREAKLRTFWISATTKSQSIASEEPNLSNVCTATFDQPSEERNLSNDCTVTVDEPSVIDDVVPKPDSQANVQDISANSTRTQYKTPAQDLLKQHIDLLNSDLCGLYKRREMNFLSTEQRKELKEKEKDKKHLSYKLKVRTREQDRQKQRRAMTKQKIENLNAAVHPDNENRIRIRPSAGRPSIESDQPLLLKTICDIAIHGSGAHEKRQCDVYRTIKTLDELHSELVKIGMKLSRSALYLRLIPRNHFSTEGKRHVNTVPVKLIRAQNDKHEKHIDSAFCTSTIRNLEELASFLGPNEVCWISQDDKCRVPIGVTAANKQSPMLMHLECRVTLPDHDWVVASKHKLIPSVYGACDIKPNGFGKVEAVTYSGPTYIALRSGKHSSSTAFSHALDFETLLNLEEFERSTKFDGDLKPVFIFSVDGGPDENPRYINNIHVSISHFIKYNLDAIFIATNAPGRSAYNRIERRMAPLSRELAGLILPHDHFGSHLDTQKNTTDEELELINFQHAGECLAEIWSKVVIDKFPTKAVYIFPEFSEIDRDSLIVKDWKWISKHVSTSQYFTQIVKCKDTTCCNPPRSSYFKIFDDDNHFLPAPIPLAQKNSGIVACSESLNFGSLFALKCLNMNQILPMSKQTFQEYPYDMYCPSIQGSLDKRICKKCNKYFASIVMLQKHVSDVHNESSVVVPLIRPLRVAAKRANELMAIVMLNENRDLDAEWVEEEFVDKTCLDLICMERNSEYKEGFPVYSMDDHFSSPWTDE